MVKYLNMIFGLVLSTSTFADTTTGNFQANAALNSTCTIFVANNLPFNFTPSISAGYAVVNRPAVFRCSSGIPYNISINGGNSGDIEDRTMTSSTTSDVLHYNIYLDNTYTTIFGDGNKGSFVPRTGTGNSTSINYYGRLDSNQFVTPAIYSDTLTFSLSY